MPDYPAIFSLSRQFVPGISTPGNFLPGRDLRVARQKQI